MNQRQGRTRDVDTSPFAPRPDRSGAERLLARTSRRADPANSLDALFAIGVASARRLVAEDTLGSEAAKCLIEHAPAMLRSLSTRTEVTTQRCVGHIPGPIRWAETASAQRGVAGTGVWVCSVVAPAPDSPAARLLAAALAGLAERARHLTLDRQRGPADRDLKVLGEQARRLSAHRSLASARRPRDLARERQRVKRQRVGHDFGPVLDVLDLLTARVGEDRLVQLGDERDALEHRVFADVLDQLEAHGVRVPALRAKGGRLGAGTVNYRHPSRATSVAPLTVGPIEVIVRDAGLAEVPTPLGGSAPVIIRSAGDVDGGVAEVMERLGLVSGRETPERDARALQESKSSS